MALTSAQKGSIGERILAALLMGESDGRLSPFAPLADDDGIDLLVYDKVTGEVAPLQIKTRTSTATATHAQFQIRRKTYSLRAGEFLLAVQFTEAYRELVRPFLIPALTLPTVGVSNQSVYQIRPSLSMDSKDMFAPFRCETMADVVERLVNHFEGVKEQPADCRP